MNTPYPHWYIIVVIILSVITAVSNIIVMSVWVSADSLNQVTILLTALSLSDLFAVSLQGMFLPIVEFSRISEYLFCVFFDFLAEKAAFLFHTWSLMITCLVAFQRFLVCAFPFKAQYIWSKRTSYLALFGSLLLSLGINIPWNLVADIDVVKMTNSSDSSCQYKYLVDKLIIDSYQNEYLPYIRVFGLQIGSLIIVLFSLTFCSYTISRQNVKIMNEKIQQTRRKTTIMTCLVMLLFVIGETPTTVGLVLEMFATSSTNGFVQWLGFTMDGVAFGNVVIIVSYLLNIWVYIAISNTFRRRLYQLLACKRQDKLRVSTINFSSIQSIDQSTNVSST